MAAVAFETDNAVGSQVTLPLRCLGTDSPVAHGQVGNTTALSSSAVSAEQEERGLSQIHLNLRWGGGERTV